MSKFRVVDVDGELVSVSPYDDLLRTVEWLLRKRNRSITDYVVEMQSTHGWERRVTLHRTRAEPRQ